MQKLLKAPCNKIETGNFCTLIVEKYFDFSELLAKCVQMIN